jgi:hypothetical protein
MVLRDGALVPSLSSSLACRKARGGLPRRRLDVAIWLVCVRFSQKRSSQHSLLFLIFVLCAAFQQEAATPEGDADATAKLPDAEVAPAVLPSLDERTLKEAFLKFATEVRCSMGQTGRVGIENRNTRFGMPASSRLPDFFPFCPTYIRTFPPSLSLSLLSFS